MKTLRRYLLGLLWVTTCMVPLTACALSGEAINGKVLEDETNKPIADALVVVRWQGHLATFAHGKTVCYHVLSTTTDKSGRYDFPAWKQDITEDWQENIRPERVALDVYKPGYQESRRPQPGVHYLTPFTGDRGERLGYLKRVEESTRCNVESENQKIRLPLLKALAKEARTIAKSKEDRRIVNSLLFAVERMDLGEEKAFSILDERRKADNE